MNEIDKITLDYFTNRSQYNSIIEKQTIFQSKQFLKEKRFYRKRILNTTREMFSNNINNIEVTNAFNSYVKSIINYLKFIDKKDILQEEYCESNNEECEKKVSFEKTELEKKDDYDEANKYIINQSFKSNIPTLDSYVVKTNTEETEKEILPIKKVINLKDPELKKKGLKKKKN